VATAGQLTIEVDMVLSSLWERLDAEGWYLHILPTDVMTPWTGCIKRKGTRVLALIHGNSPWDVLQQALAFTASKKELDNGT
jgi:hypothetical protein